MNDIYTWHNDLYPLIKKRFDLRYAKRLDLISSVAEVVCQDDVDYRMEGVGGYGALPVYDGTTVASADSKKTFSTIVTPKEHALRVSVSYKKAKLDYSGEAAKVGARLADSAYMTVLGEFYKLFGNAFTEKCADGQPWASEKHPVNKDKNSGVFSNLLSSELSVSAITEAQTRASRFVTPDGLPFSCNLDLLLVSPELEAKAREICGPDAKLAPIHNPDADAPFNAANPVYGMKYMVVGGGDSGLTGKQWAVADSLMLSEVLKLIYVTKPTVLVSPQDNPLITDYIGYVDFAFGVGDARPIIFSNPA